MKKKPKLKKKQKCPFENLTFFIMKCHKSSHTYLAWSGLEPTKYMSKLWIIKYKVG